MFKYNISGFKGAVFGFLILFGIAALACAGEYTWHGGEARRSALGGVSLAVADASAVIDLYAEGFASSLVLRDRIRLISLALSAVPHESALETGAANLYVRDHPITFQPDGDSSSGITYFFDDGSALQIKPYVMLNEGEKTLETGPPSDSMGVDSLENLYAADIVFARKLNEYFSGGATLRLAFFRDETRIERQAYIDYDDVNISSYDKILYSKAEYSISATYSPDEKTGAAVSFGSLKPLLPHYRPWIAGMKSADFQAGVNVYSPLFSNYGFTRYYEEKVFASLWESASEKTETSGVSGYDIDAGCSARGSGDSVFMVSAGLSFGVQGGYSVTSATAVDMYFTTDAAYSGAEQYNNIRNGSAHHVDLTGRLDIGDAAAAGKFTYYSAGADFYRKNITPVAATAQVFDAVVGVSLMPEGFVIPLEIFAAAILQSEKQGLRKADYSLFTAGIRGGAEYKVSEGIFMRLGFDTAYGGPSSHVNTGGIETGMQLGTAANPAYLQTGISLGAGHYNGNVEINLNLRYESTGRLPDKSGFKYGEGSTTLITDVKVFL